MSETTQVAVTAAGRGYKWLWFALAVVIAIAAYLLANKTLATAARQAELRIESRFEPRAVVVAAGAIAAQTPLTEALIAEREVPADFIPAGAVTAQEYSQFVGWRPRVALAAGDVITRNLLQAPDDASLAERLPNGMRAVTVPVDEVSSVAGLIQPGDLVDVLLIEKAELEPRVRVILQAVKVMAIGRMLGTETAELDRGSSLTLHLAPRDAQRVLLALQLGELTTVLRSQGDISRLETHVLRAQDLELASNARPAIVKRSRRGGIEVFIGLGDGIERELWPNGRELP
jgi:pilus assembly protein CpaB